MLFTGAQNVDFVNNITRNRGDKELTCYSDDLFD